MEMEDNVPNDDHWRKVMFDAEQAKRKRMEELQEYVQNKARVREIQETKIDEFLANLEAEKSKSEYDTVKTKMTQNEDYGVF